MEVSIPSYRQITNESKSFHVYSLHIRYYDWEHVVEKRYSEFLELHKVIKMLSKENDLAVPNFPKKKYWTRLTGKSQEQLDSRRLDLESYMIEVTRQPYAHSCKFFIEFMGMPVRLREQWAREANFL